MTSTATTPRGPSYDDVTWMVRQACRAPSVHNTQPWRFVWDGTVLRLYADTTRALAAADPDGRELVVSCGAALFNLRIACRNRGWQPTVTLLPDPADPRLLASVVVTPSVPPGPAEHRTFAALTRRHTRRGGFDERRLTPQLAVALQHAAEEEGARLVYVTDPGLRRRVHDLARRADDALAADPRIRAELETWTPHPAERRRDGVPSTSYGGRGDHAADVVAPRDFDLGRGVGRGEPPAATPGTVAVLVTDEDLQVDWLRAGQALERVLVTAAGEWAFAALHSQLVEVPHLRAELRRELNVDGFPQLVLRFGHASLAQSTPRRPVDEVLVVAVPDDAVSVERR